ncbi:MAG TPA: cysteine--tRNA ligase [Planctomycetes bacterium]|nr:cysteine--tRNA ligase [Planctomycetota bacterium]
MELRFRNTLTGEIEPFEPIEEGKVGLYHCGPTVYARPHIGNHRAFLFADLLRRVLEYAGFEVTQVMNLTDVGHLTDDADEGEDKLEKRARREKIDPWDLVEKVSESFFTDLASLAVMPAHHYPRATGHIPEMLEMVCALIEKGNAYQVGEDVYFHVPSFAKYGRLSGNKVDNLEAGARLEVNPDKKHPSDFALWKSDPDHLMKWESQFGPHGFPGWHIECSAMSRKYLGDRFDIHTGGEDNIFPHHECEIAQTEALIEKSWVSTWMHTRFLQVDGGKMSKSVGNVWTLDDVQERGFSPLDFRFFVLRTHYRGAMNFTWEALKGAAEARRNLADFKGRLEASAHGAVNEGVCARIDEARELFQAALAEDLNASAALAVLFDLRSDFLQGDLKTAEEASAALSFLLEVDGVFGFLGPDEGIISLSDEEVESLIAEREEARQSKNFQRADELRASLMEAGIVLEDVAEGIRWHRI